MFDSTSRYYALPTATYLNAAGQSIPYKTRRFLPQGERMPLLAEITVRDGDRMDLIAYRTLGDPLQFWRVCDANDALDPFELTAEPGGMLRIPIPRI
jgi:hypothetical protein